MTKAKLRALLLDMDGVLWRDTQPIGDLPAILKKISAKGLKVAFVTNNATRTVEQYQEKFRGFGVEVRAAGTILAALEASTGVKPIIIGKPERALLDSALAQLGAEPEETLVVGDRVETDVAAGQKGGCHTALLLSGVTSEKDARAWRPAPDYIEKDLETLTKKL